MRIKTILFLFLWLIFSLAAASYLDPDFGWHLKTGEWIWLNRDVPRTDLFSYSMPNYSWQVHAWFSELVVFRLYPVLGYAGLAVFFGLFGAVAFILAVSTQKILFYLVPLILAGLASMNFMAVRPKVFSLFLAALVFLIIRKSFQNSRRLLVLPLVFMVWGQFHGGFSLGLGVLLLLILSDFFQLVVKKEKEVFGRLQYGLFSFLLSLLAIMVNPYGWRVYQEVYLTLFSSKLHWQIAEWIPYNFTDLSMVFYVSLFFSFLILEHRRLPVFEKAASVFLFMAGFSSQRLMVYFFIFSLPVTASLTENLFQQLKKEANFLKLWRHWRWALIVFLFFSAWSVWWHQKQLKPLSEERYYPAGAMAFLREGNLSKNLFSVYNWGGYLIWKLPEKKVFIDGRMAIWEQDGYSAFKEYLQIISGQTDFQPVFERLEVSTVLLPVGKEVQLDWLSRWLIKIFDQGKEPFRLGQRLLGSGWQVVYEDEVAKVYQGR